MPGSLTTTRLPWLPFHTIHVITTCIIWSPVACYTGKYPPPHIPSQIFLMILVMYKEQIHKWGCNTLEWQAKILPLDGLFFSKYLHWVAYSELPGFQQLWSWYTCSFLISSHKLCLIKYMYLSVHVLICDARTVLYILRLLSVADFIILSQIYMFY